jgi:hypothetical protein
MTKDNNIGKVVLVELPNNKRPRYRWIVRIREDGRYIARSPKIGVLIRDLNKKLDKDYNSEHLLPKNFTYWKPFSKTKSNKKSKNKTKKNIK